MRWIPFAILLYLVLIIQCSLGKVLVFQLDWPGAFGPDLLLIFAVFIFLRAPDAIDGVLAGCAIGFMWDAGMVASTSHIGPMSIICAFSAWWIIGIREALFQEKALPQMVLVFVFVAFAHSVWIAIQSLLELGAISWGDFGAMIVVALLSAVSTSLLTPLIIMCLSPFKGFVVSNSNLAESGRLSRF